MHLQAGPGRWLLVAVVAICAGGGGAWAAAGAARGHHPASRGRGRAGVISTESPAMFRRAIARRLRANQLDYLWIDCVRSGRVFEGVPVVRCNVDFGEPHIVAYCSVLRDGRLLTSAEDPAIPCGHDDAGFSYSVTQYG